MAFLERKPDDILLGAMPISIYVDNNVWDFLFTRQMDLAKELPRDEFCVCITREAEFEIPPMPPEKRAFAEATIAKCLITTDAFFGFNDESLPAAEQRVAGFDQGRWASPEELAFIAQQKTALKDRMRPSKLYHGEADLSLAARSVHSIVLSLDRKQGPINVAYEQGGKVVFLTDFDKSGLSLREFIHVALARVVPASARSPDMSSNARPETFEEIKPDADDLLVFIDDTGHETFAGNQGFYGLGGCLTTGFAYEHLKPRWREVRRIINDDADAPLHGSDITANPKPESFAALRTFFEDRSFVRTAVTTTKHVGLPTSMHPCVPVMGQLCKEIEAVVSVLPCKRVWIILESSDRADPVVKQCFGQLTSLNAPRPIRVEHCFMPKSANEPGLEVADFIVSAAGSQIQRRLRKKTGLAPDFNDVFGRLPAEGARYREVARVTVHADGLVSIDGVRLIGDD
jgi:hypothetical protein